MTYREEPNWQQFVTAVQHAGLHGRYDFPTCLEPRASTGLNEASPSDGGFTVPSTWLDGAWERAIEFGRILSKCFRVPVTRGNRLVAGALDETSRANGARLGGVLGYWTEEGNAPTATKPRFRTMLLQPHKYMVVVYCTDEMLADLPAFAAILERLLIQEATFAIEDMLLNGPGTATPLGILRSDALISVTPPSGVSTLTTECFTSMLGRLWPACHPNAVWALGLEAFAVSLDLQRNGESLVQFANDGTARILGKEAIVCEYPATLGAANDVVLFDPGEIIVADRGSSLIRSAELNFVENESAFRFTFRIDAQPGWSAPVVPRNCAASASPFVGLAAR